MLAALVLAALQLSSDPLVPQLAQVRLQVGATSIAPVEPIAAVKPNALAELPVWDVETPTGTIHRDLSGYEFVQGAARIPLEFNPLRGSFLCADSEVAWFTSFDFTNQVKRVSLSTGRLLDTWNLPVEVISPAYERGGSIASASLDEGRLLLLYTEWTTNHLFCLDARSGETLWEWSESCAPMERRARSSTGGAQLVPFGDLVVVHPRQDSPIVALDKLTGAVRWRVEKLWEYQMPPGFSASGRNGPCRFGERRFCYLPVDHPNVNEARKELEATRRGWAGLAPHALVSKREGDEPMLIAFGGTEDRNASFSNGFASPSPEYAIYGITFQGGVAQVLPVPQLPQFSGAVSFGDRMVVHGPPGELACLARTSFTSARVTHHSPERHLSIAWRRDFRGSPPAARFALEPNPWPSGSLCRELAVLLGAWGRIESEGERIARFPLSLVDPATGNARTAELVVPFSGSITTPEPDPDFDDTFLDQLCRQWLGVTGVHVGDGRLRLTLSNGLGADGWTATFALADVLAAR